MADRKLTETREDEPQVRVEPAPQRPLALVQGVPWMMVIVLLALSGWLVWKAFFEEDLGDPIATSVEAFSEQNSLTVFSAELSPVVSAEDSRYLGLVNSRQIAVIPTRVDYTLNMGAIGEDRLQWNAESETLNVQLPTLQISRPNLDEARAQYLREGLWITREAQDELSRKNTKLAEEQAVKRAASPVLMELARNAAKDAVRQNLSIPLRVAGYGDVTVNVQFDGEDTSD